MRILMFEDDRKVGEFVARGLRAERFAVDLTGNGREAESYLESVEYDLLILDLALPQLSGSKLLQRVCCSHPALPVLVLTARDAIEDKVALFEAGADDCLSRPFDFAELVIRIKALLRRPPAERVDVLRIADLELNRLTRQVKRHDQRVDLTAKEYALLEYLLGSPGRVFSRTSILNHVWDLSFEGVTNIVDVYVRYLRKKIDEPYSIKLIHTVRGVGYSLREPSTSRNESSPRRERRTAQAADGAERGLRRIQP
jgi:DNA-binding response OmpR family regulator